MRTCYSALPPLLACLGLALSCVPSAAEQRSKVEDAAFACSRPEGCVYFFDLNKKSPAFRNALQAGAKASGIRFHPSVFDGPASPMPVRQIEGRRAVIGGSCEARNCEHNVQVLYYEEPRRLVGIYSDRDYRKHPFGNPTSNELRALSK